MRNAVLTALALAWFAYSSTPAKAQAVPAVNGASPMKSPPAIQWFATLDRGLAEARRTGKPILFASAAPHCAGVPGMW